MLFPRIICVSAKPTAPHFLCRHGLNEVMFDHFISSLHAACDVVPLNAEEDYRRQGGCCMVLRWYCGGIYGVVLVRENLLLELPRSWGGSGTRAVQKSAA